MFRGSKRVRSATSLHPAIPDFYPRWKAQGCFFRGLAVPGVPGVVDNLVAIWRSKNGQRFQNYRASFTIIDAARIQRQWLVGLTSGDPKKSPAPTAWQQWTENGNILPLTAEPSITFRTQSQQTPQIGRAASLVRTLFEYFNTNPTDFEACAIQLVAMLDYNMSNMIVTRRSADGGRDATGDYMIGPVGDRITLTFSLEAKCYAANNGVGVRELSRLISRLRHREFGILVTTSFVSRQAYEEIRSDQHPIIIISGADIAQILLNSGHTTTTKLKSWLEHAFPKPNTLSKLMRCTVKSLSTVNSVTCTV